MMTLYIGLAAFFRSNDFVLHDTEYERDVKIQQDTFTGKASENSQGVRIKYATAQLK